MPIQHDGVIYASRGYRSGPFAAIRPGGKGDISKSHVVWKAESGAPYVSSLVYHDGLLYMAGDVGVISASLKVRPASIGIFSVLKNSGETRWT